MGRNLKINRDFVLFAVGAIVGSTATWLYLKDEYDRRLKEDVDSVKESFGRLYKKEEKPEEDKDETSDSDSDKEDDNTVNSPQTGEASVISYSVLGIIAAAVLSLINRRKIK